MNKEPPTSHPNESVHRAPSEGSALNEKYSSDDIFHRVLAAAHHETETGPRELLFSGIAAGLAISITFLLYASGMAASGGAVLVGSLLYPLGFVYIILGDYQLYTENTLPPVALVLERLASLRTLFSVWGLVLLGNLIGGMLGAVTLAYTGVFTTEAAEMAVHLAEKGAFEQGWWDLFFKAMFAGLIVAGVVWLDHAAQDTTSRFLLVYIAFLAIPVGGLYHVVVSATEAMYLMFLGRLGVVTGMVDFVLPVFLGNTLGGVILVTVVNYFQTANTTYYDEDGRQLSIKEWVFGKSDN